MMMMMMAFAFLVKMPIFLVHLWLPGAHVESPVFGSVISAGCFIENGWVWPSSYFFCIVEICFVVWFCLSCFTFGW
jgi:hypothetical protein